METNLIFDPSGNRVIGFRDPQYTTIDVYSFDPRNYLNYSGFDLILESQFTHNFDFNGSYTLSWTFGPGFNELQGNSNQSASQFGNPRQSQLFAGFGAGVDTRHIVRTQTTYQFFGFHTGLIANWISGVAQRRPYSSGPVVPARYRSPVGTEPGTPINDVRSWTELRTPDFFAVSLHVGYDFFDLIEQHLLLGVDIENLFNNLTATGIITDSSINFGDASARPTPLRAQLSVRYRY